jgi:hypothetical protein
VIARSWRQGTVRHGTRSRQRRIAPALLGLVAAVTSSACNPFAGPDEEVEVVIAAAHFGFGEPIRFEIRNHTDEFVRIGLCEDGTAQIRLLRRLKGQWTDLGAPCRAFLLHTIAPAAAHATSRVGATEEGLYGLSLDYRILGGTGTVSEGGSSTSGPFHVTP